MEATGCATAGAICTCATAQNQRERPQVLPAYGHQDLRNNPQDPKTKSHPNTMRPQITLGENHGSGHFYLAKTRTFLLCVDTRDDDQADGQGAAGLGAIASVDVNVLCGEIAGPDTGAALAGMQRDDDGDIFREHLAMCGAFVEGVFLAAAANFYPGEGNIGALEIEGDTGAAGGGQDAAPVGIGAGDGGFYQWRIRDGERDLLCGAIAGSAANL